VLWVAVLAAQRWNFLPVISGVLESRVVQWLGAISYPLYLVNEPVQRAAAMVLAPLVHGDEGVFTMVWLPAAVVAPVVVAAVVHRGVERPLMRGVGGWRWRAWVVG
jgi:peptidoglycan/LPS O-acetylase OafA/YrhL